MQRSPIGPAVIRKDCNGRKQAECSTMYKVAMFKVQQNFKKHCKQVASITPYFRDGKHRDQGGLYQTPS